MAARGSIGPGTTFAQDFEVVRHLARGGMGDVWIAEQRSTGKLRALKTMSPSLVASERGRERFAQEAKVGARIGSVHVVEVIAAGIDEDTPWLAMELLEGQDLAGWVAERGRPLAREEIIEVVAQLRDALAAAHRQGIVHRDLKPENLFIDRTPRRGVPFLVKVLDFGIAAVVHEGKRGATVTTAIGSPYFMAPEQAQRGGRVSPATDVWALGLIGFWLVTGCHFWLGANVSEEEFNLSALLLEVMTQSIPSASQRLRELEVSATLPVGFDAWLARCLERDPEARVPDAGQALDELLAILEEAAPAALPVAVADAPLPRAEPSSSEGVAKTEILDRRSDARATPPTVPLDRATPPTVPIDPRDPGADPGSAAGDVEASTPAVVPRTQPWVYAAGLVALVAIGVGWWALSSDGPRHRDGPAAVAGGPPVDPELPLPEPERAPPEPAPPAPAPPAAELGTCPGGTIIHSSAPLARVLSNGAIDHVRTSTFCLDRHEVTVGRYETCVAAGACDGSYDVRWPRIRQPDRQGYRRFCNGIRHAREMPVNCVTWAQAAAFCRWSGGRLPTEAEWEYATFGTERRPHPWGDAPLDATRANICDRECAATFRRAGMSDELDVRWADGFGTTAPPGSFPAGASPRGVQDLFGNVREFVADWNGTVATGTPEAPRLDPTGPPTGTERISRGASWESSAAGLFDRNLHDPDTRSPMDGFRCVYAVGASRS